MKKILSLILTLTICLCGLSLIGTVYAENDYFYIGSYPQSEVKDTTITDELDKLAPDWESWTSYSYYCSVNNKYGSMTQGDWMRYTDVTYGGEKYRGVKFTQYRPQYTHHTPEFSYQDNNGYDTDTVYWFKFESLKWRILDADKGLVLCETIIDAQPYTNTIYRTGSGFYYYFNDADCTTYANDYATSSIRAWLNDDFYNTAFTSTEQNAIIETKNLNNDGYYTLIGTTGYENLDSDATDDKVFLLSYDDVLNSKYGFNADSTYKDPARASQSTDYAKCQGLYVVIDEEYQGFSEWFLRSPSKSSELCCAIDCAGHDTANNTVHITSGIRPAMTVDLSYTPAETTTGTDTSTSTDTSTDTSTSADAGTDNNNCCLPSWLCSILEFFRGIFEFIIDKLWIF